MDVSKWKTEYENSYVPMESVLIKFLGVDGYDVYNCSVPFMWNQKHYIYGRIERHDEWMRSWVGLFERVEKDTYQLVPKSMIYQLEDPFVSVIHGELVLGGTHVRIRQGKLDSYCGYFYKGHDIMDMYYFTTGPDRMKDIRLVELKDGKIGVFSRPRGEHLIEKYGTAAIVGFAVIDSLDDLSAEVIENAENIPGLFKEGQWGGCNQAYLLSSGMIGVVGHICYNYIDEEDINQACYMNMAFVMDPNTREIYDYQIIGTRKLFPPYPIKKKNLADCVFPSGIVMRSDGKVDLYSGLSDSAEGRIAIENPFNNYGSIVSNNLYGVI
ncbi:MAG: DUF1861 family protein [Anaerocolumna sp.]